MTKRASLLLLPALGLFLAISPMAEPAAGFDSGHGQQVAKPAAAAAPQKALYDRLGGAYAIATVVDDFIEALLVDDILNANPAIKEARVRVPKVEQGELLQIVGTTKADIVVAAAKAAVK